MFQKMSDEEIERRLREEDAQSNREEIVSDRTSSSTLNSNPLHPDTAGDFNRRYGGSLNHPENYYPGQPSQSGVQNAVVNKREAGSRNKKRKKFGILRNHEADKEYSSPQPQNKKGIIRRNESNFDDESKDSDAPSGFEKMMYKAGYLYGKTVGRGLMSSAYVWTNFIYLSLQIWLGIIAVFAIGLVLAIELFIGDGVTRKAFDTFMSAIGVDWDFYLVAFLCYLLLIVTCYVQLFGVAIQAKALGLHPLSGRGAYFKTGTFLFCFILYWVPILNCLPLVNLYIFSIQAYPR